MPGRRDLEISRPGRFFTGEGGDGQHRAIQHEFLWLKFLNTENRARRHECLSDDSESAIGLPFIQDETSVKGFLRMPTREKLP